MTAEPTTDRYLVPKRWLFLFLCAAILATSGWFLVVRTRSTGSGRADQRLAVGIAVEPRSENRGGRDDAADPADASPEPLDPARFRIVKDGVVEDTATGIQAKLADAKKGERPPSLQLLADIFDLNHDLRQDLRDGVGARPVRLLVDSIKVDSEVYPIGLDTNRALAVPRRADVTGWWSGGYAPGEAGPTVIVGHYDSKTAPGVFAKLKDVEEGDIITIEQSDGSTFTFIVVQVERLQKSAFPTSKVYGKTDGSTLRLVTCGGKFNRKTGHYVDNVIAYADLISFEHDYPMTPQRLREISGPAGSISNPLLPLPTNTLVDATSRTGVTASTQTTSTTTDVTTSTRPATTHSSVPISTSSTPGGSLPTTSVPSTESTETTSRPGPSESTTTEPTLDDPPTTLLSPTPSTSTS